MRKLSDVEDAALWWLQNNGSVLLDGNGGNVTGEHMRRVFDSLVKKKRAIIEVTDGGNRYHAA